MPELVRDGENGFLVDSIDAAVESVSLVASLDRGRVRGSVSQRFAVERMVEDYLAVYHRVVSGSGQPVE
jgi:glycosyltransferase involved in cell wall biosynthesis